MNRRSEVLTQIERGLKAKDVLYDCFGGNNQNEDRLIFPGTGLEVILSFEGNHLYVNPRAQFGDESKYSTQDAIFDIILNTMRANYQEDHTHMTNALVRDEERSREGHIVLKTGPVKIREVKDLPHNSNLKIYRDIARLVNDCAISGVPMSFGYSPTKLIDEAYHKFDLEKQVA